MRRFTLAFFLVVALAEQSEASIRGTETNSRFRFPKLSISWKTTCAVLDDGTARCWGANEEGQVGDGSRTTQKTPAVSPASLTGVLTIAAGRDHTCALVIGGALGSSVRCWGDNQFGQLGDGTNSDRSLPVTVQGLQGVVAIAAGENHTCAIVVGGTVRCWGEGAVGKLGNGGTSNQPLPVPVQGLTNAIALSAGSHHNCVLLANGTAMCWGWNFSGQLGNGTAGLNSYESLRVPVSGLSGVVGISAGSLHTCALLVDGTGKCWGANFAGQLGIDSTQVKTLPTTVSQLSGAVSISAGDEHTCAVLVTGRIRCWGQNTDGRLGDGSTNQRLNAGFEVASVTNAVEVEAGANHTCAIDATGQAYCWGSNDVGQFGNGTNNPSPTAVTVPDISGNIGARGITAGLNFSCARRGTGAPACWGTDANGALGNGSGGSSPNPGAVSGLSIATMVDAGADHACAVLASGVIRCWGGNDQGELGTGDTNNRQSPGGGAGLTTAVAVASGGAHTCALLVDGTVQCWGSNLGGQLGDGTQNSSLMPVPVQGLSGATAIAASGGFTCALIVDGTVQCWGDNRFGQLGVGEMPTESSLPVPLSLTNIVGISTGQLHACAVSVAGSVHCWGANEFGQLGNTTTQTRKTPDTVASLTDALSIAAGYRHSCAVRANGSASCWGRNDDGELAAEDQMSHNRPTPVIRNFSTVRGVSLANPLGSIVGIAAALETSNNVHTCAVQVNGQPLCWGANAAGQTGVSGTADQLRPVVVPSFTANVQVTGSVRASGRVAVITALVNCEVGGQAHIFVSLTQGTASGNGTAVEQCTSGLVEVPIAVSARGPERFQDGPATASLDAVIQDDGDLIQQQLWTRQVTLTPQ